ncbi:ATP-binding protein [Methylocystis parvus]|uniref:Sensory/regulatory protein RpfC n=1 Tax=Methylocystis parvus TaxID=134 RepID=A0A6B8M1G6_9HYPH|nr:ATP-binding protein [Methylocystis parvus]QGM96096.1 response regulator [Methylocystis parvus]WBK00081.1 ATP-binding protein [Methylocystis parvus OBBP]
MSDGTSSTRIIANRAPKRSIARKLAFLVAIAVATAAMTMSAVLLWQETKRYAVTKSESLFASAHVFASAAAQGVAEKNQTAVYQAIKAIGQIPGLLYARIENNRGQLLAVMGGATQLDGDLRIKEGQALSISPLDVFNSRSIQVEAPIVNGGVDIGKFTLVADTKDLADELADALKGAALGALVALAIGLLVSMRLQKGVTRPVFELSEAIWRIRRNHDYADRVAAKSDDEVGLLIDGFNAMLEELEERDKSLAAHRRNLEKEVGDRTQDLRLAKDAAEMANAAKSDFLATMSHEIRTPMNGVMVMAELLAASDLPERQRRYAEVISKSGQSLLAIINDILDFSKIESGKLQLEKIALDPSALAEDVTSLFAARAREKGLDLVSYVSPATPRFITGDPIRINQVIGNLVNNALKFTETGSVILKVGPDPKREGHIRFAVTDTGVGIRAHKLKDIFGVFTQADQSTTRRFGGTGLGLAISKRLIDSMDGEIEVKSVYGRGSTFSFSIPTGEAENGDAWPRARRAGMTAAVAVTGEATRATLLRYLSEAGYESAAVQDKAEFSADLMIADPDRVPQARRAEGDYLLCLATFGDPAAHRLVQERRADAAVSRPLRRSEIGLLLRRIRVGHKLAGALDQRKTRKEEPQRQDGLRVLVADDTAINREVAIETLRQLGAVVTTAENGREAVAAVESQTFDVALMDVSMPEMDGFEATRRIRDAERQGQRPRLPIIAVTAHVVGDAADAWRAAGMDDVLHKPYTIQSLAKRLSKFAPSNASEAAEPPVGIAAKAEAGDVAASPAMALLNEDKLRELKLLTENGPTPFLRRVFSLYLEHAPKAATEMRQALERGDVRAVGRAAHALKSMSLNIGVDRVVSIAEDLERRANASAVSIEAIDALESTVQATCALIERFRGAEAPAAESSEEQACAAAS